ncbi:MAG: hypothetical protein IKH19_00875 [Muribaculaceae bacterium]|nr:hypothetical protein [Muribaculaceae bacterium]
MKNQIEFLNSRIMCLHKRTFPRPDDNKNQEECGEPVANSADCDPVAEGKAHIDSQTGVDANGAMSAGEMMARDVEIRARFAALA